MSQPPDEPPVAPFAAADPRDAAHGTPPTPDDLADDPLRGRFAAAEPTAASLEAEQVRVAMFAELFGEASAPPRLGPYEIVRWLGRGATGTVYEGRDPTGRRVALKTLCQPDLAAIQRFKQEFRCVADLGHRNLATVEALAFDDGRREWYLAMEYVPGVPWLDHVRPGGALDLEVLRDALGQLAAGVDVLHAAGLLHRDLKPSNVLVTPEGRVKIVDFGLAELVDAAGRTVAGTPGYLAPELRRGATNSPASDVYAVGVMLHQALTGELPAPPHAPTGPDDLAALCRDLLAARPDDRPSSGDVMRRLGLTPAPTALPVTFVGRARELAACALALAAAPALVLLVGPSGAGKSALLARLLGDLRRPGALVLAARCYEGENVPHKALDGVVDALARHLVSCPSEHVPSLLPEETQALTRLFPALARVRALAPGPRTAPPADPREARRRALAGLRRLLAGLARERPLVLAIDDLQWGDADSARLLADLFAPPGPPAVQVVAAVRSDVRPTSSFFAALAQAGLACPVHDIPVDPLTPDDALALAAALLGAPTDGDAELAAAIARESHGSPLFIEAMVRRRSAGAGPGEALRAQLLDLDGPARAALERLAVAGRPLPRGLALPTRGTDERLLQIGRLVRAGGGRDTVELYHDLVRTVVLRELAPAARASHHRTLAEALAAAPDPDPDELVLHFHGAGDLPRAADWALRAAARAAAALAFARAAELYARALAWGTYPAAQVLEISLARADALAHAGRCGEAAPLYLGAAALTRDRLQELALRRRAAEQYLVSGHVESGLALLAPLARELGLPFPAGSAATIARFGVEVVQLAVARRLPRRERGLTPLDRLRLDTCWSAGKGLGFIDPTRAAVFSNHGTRLALRAGDPRAIARADAYLALMDVNKADPGKAAAGRRTIDEARATADRLADPHLAGLTTILGGVAAMNHGEWSRTLRLVEAGAARLRAANVTDDTWERGISHSMALHALLMLGDFPALRARADRMHRDAEDAGDRFAAVVAILYLAHATLAAGDPDGARGHVRRALSMWTYDRFSFQHWLALGVEVGCDLYQGRGAAAWRRVTAAWPALHRSQLLRMQVPRIDAHLLRASAALAARAPALRREAARAAEILGGESIGLAAAARALIDAQLAAVSRDPAAPARLAAAADRLAAGEMSALAAAVRLAAGRVLGVDTDEPTRALARLGVRDPRRWSATVAPALR